TLDSATSASKIYAYSALIGIGAGSYLQADYGVSQALLGPESIPNAVGFTAIGQNVGVTVFLAIAGAVFNNQAVKSLAPLLPDMAEGNMKELIAGTSSQIFATLDDETRAEALEAIVQSIGKTFGVVLAGGALTVIMALFMPVSSLLRIIPDIQLMDFTGAEIDLWPHYYDFCESVGSSAADTPQAPEWVNGTVIDDGNGMVFDGKRWYGLRWWKQS
ncbi:MAG: hypothetical protein Q9183_005691, partial [Haloplaca sp. 2 TL-2023]